MKMPVKIKTRKTKINPKKPNPSFIDKILGRTRTAKDSINITVTDGVLILTGDKLSSAYPELNNLLETKLTNFKIEFQPVGTNKKYIINRPKNLIKDEDEDSDDLRIRQMGRLARRNRG